MRGTASLIVPHFAQLFDEAHDAMQPLIITINEPDWL